MSSSDLFQRNEKELKTWQNVVTACKDLHPCIKKVTIIARANYKPEAYTSQTDIATAWMDDGRTVNENQQILDFAWGSKCLEAGTFNVNGLPNNEMRFYGSVYKILKLEMNLAIQKDEYSIIAKHWCQLFQNDKNKMESFPAFIIDIIVKYSYYQIQTKCLISKHVREIQNGY